MPKTSEKRNVGEDEESRSDTMRAIVQSAFGSVETLHLTDIERPQVGADEVLIEVHAAGVDRGVWHLMMGMPYLVRLAGFGFTKPKTPTPGLDVSGRVAGVGSDVSRFEVGDEIFGIARGAYAEYAVAKESKLAHKPANLSFEQAAVAAISGITALQGLVDVGRLEPGSRVLVIGASGGVGSHAVQLAKALGAEVTGVASGRKLELVRSLGADHAIDYTTTDYLDGTTQYDLILDTGGLNPLRLLRRALDRDGTLVIVGGEGGGRITGGIGRQLRGVLMSPFISQRLTMFISSEDRTHLERLAEYMASGRVEPAIGRRYRLEDVPAAIADLQAGKASGKSVIVVRDSQDNHAK
jgi:NADPH:quinone reductase-like Zn-dependent oxidoreductase